MKQNGLSYKYFCEDDHVQIQRGWTGGPDPPLKNQENIGFSSNTGPDPLKITATKPAFNGGPSPGR